jgi:hypothetical protein
MDEQLKNTHMSTGFYFPAMPNEEINKITKEVPLEEDSCKYLFSQNLNLLQLQRKGEIQFQKPATLDAKVFVNEKVCAFLIMINKVIVDFKEVCECPKMTACPDLEFLCVLYIKLQDCNGMNYAYHFINTIQCLITSPSFYPSPENVPEKGYSAYGKYV